jgi:hypothetical protein
MLQTCLDQRHNFLFFNLENLNFNFVTLIRAASQPVALLYSPVLNWLSPDVPVQNQKSNLSSEILDRAFSHSSHRALKCDLRPG